MALDSFLLEILVCPATHQRVELAKEEVVKHLNQAVASGEINDEGGEPVSKPVEALLVRSDGAIGYPVRQDIPEMLVERGIPMSSFTTSGGEST